MASKLITALKENKNDTRKKVVVIGTIVVATVVAGIVLTKLNANQRDVIVLTETGGDLLETVTDATSK